MAEAKRMRIHWPDGRTSWALAGTDWLVAARDAQHPIPTGCLGGSCGACEISVNGEPVRACLAAVPELEGGVLTVDDLMDPSW